MAKLTGKAGGGGRWMLSRGEIFYENAAVLLALAGGLVFYFGAFVFAHACPGRDWLLQPAMASVPVVVAGFAVGLGRFFRESWLARLALIGAFGGVLLSFFCGYVAGNMTEAIDRGRQKRTLATLREVGGALEIIREREGVLPRLSSVHTLNSRYLLRLSETDGWCGSIELSSGRDGYVVASRGKRSELDPQPWSGGEVAGFEADLVFRDGEFFQFPQGLAR